LTAVTRLPNEALGTGDVRKARDGGQDSCGGSSSPKTMRNKSPKAQNIVHGRVAADTRNSAPLTHFFANALRTMRSTLKQAFTSLKVSMRKW